MGIEAVKSSTPAPCRTMIKDGLKLMMNGTEEEVINFIDKCRNDFKALPPEQIAFPRSVSDVIKYKSHSSIYTKGTPIHCRGALLFNHYVKEKKLTNHRASGKDENTVLTPIIPMTLERAIEFIREGEIVEVTPANIRLRKVLLSATGRHTARPPKA